MQLKEIVIHVNGADDCKGRIEQAARLAERHSAHLVGLYVVDIPVLAAYSTFDAPAEIYTLQRDAWLERAETARQLFEAAAASRSPSIEWRQDEGATVDRLCVNARHADLLLTGLRPDDAFGDDRWQSVLASTVMSAAVPIITVPPEGVSSDPGRFITIGWDGGREATRAVREALPLLTSAEQVSVACVDPGAGSTNPIGTLGEVPGADIAHWLARHGVNVESQTVVSGEKSTGEALLEWAKAQGADLLVMGAYGHSRIRELLLGGVTRHVLHNAQIPVLMSH